MGKNSCACVHACMHACMCACVHAYIHAYVTACRRACMHACVCACVRACVRSHARVHASMRVCVRFWDPLLIYWIFLIRIWKYFSHETFYLKVQFFFSKRWARTLSFKWHLQTLPSYYKGYVMTVTQHRWYFSFLFCGTFTPELKKCISTKGLASLKACVKVPKSCEQMLLPDVQTCWKSDHILSYPWLSLKHCLMLCPYVQ